MRKNERIKWKNGQLMEQGRDGSHPEMYQQRGNQGMRWVRVGVRPSRVLKKGRQVAAKG